MKFGFFTDKGLDPQDLAKDPWNKTRWHPDLNRHGYRCPDWDVMPDGKKNVVILGCSHTFGQGLHPGDHWVDFLKQHNTNRLRYWNLGVPGASGHCCVRRLWGAQKLINPKIVIMCWPELSRRVWYGENRPLPVHGTDEKNKFQTEKSDLQEFLQNVFYVEKYGEVFGAKTFHCFASNPVEHEDLKSINVLEHHTLRNCWPHWDKFTSRDLQAKPSLALDDKHFGKEHHERFAQLFLDKFAKKLK